MAFLASGIHGFPEGFVDLLCQKRLQILDFALGKSDEDLFVGHACTRNEFLHAESRLRPLHVGQCLRGAGLGIRELRDFVVDLRLLRLGTG